jgi:hypothetical protein
MKASSTGETDINVVAKYFRLTFVFNGLITSLNLCLSSFIALKLFLIFKMREVLIHKTCLEGGNLVNHACTIMHHWMPFQQLSSRPHAKDKHGWEASITLQEIHGGM